MADTTRNEPPRLHIAHHQAYRIDHTGVGEYQVTMYLRVEMINTEKEMVHVQFLVDGTPQGNPQLLGDDGSCEQMLVLAPATHPHISVLLTWRHDPSPKPISLCDGIVKLLRLILSPGNRGRIAGSLLADSALRPPALSL